VNVGDSQNKERYGRHNKYDVQNTMSIMSVLPVSPTGEALPRSTGLVGPLGAHSTTHGAWRCPDSLLAQSVRGKLSYIVIDHILG
jgi:hypothetical protein